MRFNVVCSDIAGDRILPRLARLLADKGGMGLSTSPRPDVDWNIFMVYIDYAELFAEFSATKIAAWFTHLDTPLPQKVRWWETAAERVDYRLTGAKMYADILRKYGPTAITRVPIDQDAFFIAEPLPLSGPWKVGLSGFVPVRKRQQQSLHSRKGENLVHELMHSDLAKHLDIRATGGGWPVRKQAARQIAKLPEFYQKIDIFLCTSTIEGIPMPPLEALSCGKPIVIPEGVGLLDELPKGPGFYRYPAGNYAAMENAIKFCIDDLSKNAVAPERQRAAVSEFTAENFLQDFVHALDPEKRRIKEERAIKIAENVKRGAYYVAFGKKARACAAKSIATFRQHMPKDIEIALASTEPLGCEDHFIKTEDKDVGGRWAKLAAHKIAKELGWDIALYLDADTEIIADVSVLYDFVKDGWELVIAKNPQRFHTIRNMRRPDNEDECQATYKQLGSEELMQLNGGVFAFSVASSAVAKFFADWNEEYNIWCKRDQAALLRALWKNPLRVYCLGNEWNTVTRYIAKEKSAGILHYPQTARRSIGLTPGRLDSSEAWKSVGGKKS